jgi:hypothetical protein
MSEPKGHGIPLVNTRTTFQRTHDARFFTGRIRRLKDDLVNVVCSVEQALVPGESFAFQVFGAGHEAFFFASFRTEAAKSSMDSNEREYVFRINGDITLRQAAQDPRFTTDGLTASMDVPGLRRLESARVLDVSMSGLSILSPMKIEKGEVIKIGINVGDSIIQAESEVRYSIRDKTHASYHRVGLLLKGMDRISAIRWRNFYAQTVENSRYHRCIPEAKAS